MPAVETTVLIESYRSHGEDRAEVLEVGDSLVVALADGAGGRPGGAEAAETVIERVRIASHQLSRLHDPRAWAGLLSEIDDLLTDHPTAGETTAVVLAITPAGIAGASVGDSGAWLITPAGYEDLTADQHPKPFIGTGMARPVEFRAQWREGTLLLATDGLLKYTSDEQICAVVREADLPTAARRLIDLVRLRSGSLPDDLAVVLARLER